MSHRSKIQYWGTFPLREAVEEVFSTLESRLKDLAIQTEIDIPADQRVTTDRELLKRGMHNLILNAADAMPEGGSVVITSTEGPNGVELEVADTGEMLTEEECIEAFQPNSTVRYAESSWGLAAVRHIAEVLGSGIEARNCPEGGVAFTLRIPRATAIRAAA